MFEQKMARANWRTMVAELTHIVGALTGRLKIKGDQCVKVVGFYIVGFSQILGENDDWLDALFSCWMFDFVQTHSSSFSLSPPPFLE